MYLSEHIFIPQIFLKALGSKRWLCLIQCTIELHNEIKTKGPFDQCIMFDLLNLSLAEGQRSSGRGCSEGLGRLRPPRSSDCRADHALGRALDERLLGLPALHRPYLTHS